MEWCVPLQKLEVGKVQIGEIIHNDKSLVPLAYFDGQNTFNSLNIFLPKLKILEFDEKSGKLVLSMAENNHAQAKLLALQNILLGAVYITQKSWFKENYTYEVLNNNFKPIISSNTLQLYYPVSFNTDIHIYKDGVWHTKYTPGLIKPTDSIRIMFRIQGISFHKNYNSWTGKFRLQHRIYAVLVDSSSN